jgi:N-acetylglucosaminyl-diphospho-decaprenol L-rhamnosyltransferase
MPSLHSTGPDRGARSLSIVIVNWNTGAMLRQCLDSIPCAQLPAGWHVSRVVIVDNASDDGSADDLPGIDHSVELIRNTTNRGFAAACNQGAAVCNSELLLFLNPDTRLYDDSLARPILRLIDTSQPGVGIVGIRLVDGSGQTSRCCARFPRAWHFLAQGFGLNRMMPSMSHLMLDWDHDTSRQVDQVIGAFFMTRLELFHRLRGFDERFFVYFEEVDFARRAHKLGLHSEYIADAHALHIGGVSSGQVLDRRLMYSLRSRLIYAGIHFGPLERALAWSVTWTIEPLARIINALLRGRHAEASAIVRGYRLLLREYGLTGSRGTKPI